MPQKLAATPLQWHCKRLQRGLAAHLFVVMEVFMPKTPRSLKASAITGPIATPEPSRLAAGLNLSTVISIQNHWREYYNPLRALDLQRYIALYDFSRRGLNAELQNVYREMEQLFPVLIALISRRTAQLRNRDFIITTLDEDYLPPGATQAMADEQADCLRQAYAAVTNKREAVRRLFLGAFRGWSHLEKIYAHPGTADWTVNKLEFVEQWHWTRKSMYAEWEYVAAATQSNSGIAVDAEQFVIYEAPFALDRLALLLWIRCNLCEKDWDALCAIYGIPRPGVIMPANVPGDVEEKYLQAAESFAAGAAAALPNGTTVIPQPLGDLKGDIFNQRIDHLEKQLVLAGTGGRLTMLSANTGLGDKGQAAEHAAAFDEIGDMDAGDVSECFNLQFDSPILDREFPGQAHLARASLAAAQETDTAAICAEILQLSQAGYQVAPELVKEKTGYEVTIKQAAPGAIAPKEPEEPVTNRAITESPVLSDKFESAAATAVAAETSENLAHAARQVGAVLQIDDDVLRATRLAELMSGWDKITADTLLAVKSDAIESVIGTAYASGLQTAEPPAPKSAKNRNRKK